MIILNHLWAEFSKLINETKTLADLARMENKEGQLSTLIRMVEFISVLSMRRQGEFLKELKKEGKLSPDNDYCGYGRHHCHKLIRLAEMPWDEFETKALDAALFDDFRKSADEIVREIIPTKSDLRLRSFDALDDLGLL